MNEVGEFQKYPIWKEAVDRFVAADFQYGDVIPHEWFWNAFGLRMPKPEDVMTVAEMTKLRLEFLGNFNPLRDELLMRHQLCLATETSKGYLLVSPRMQVRLTQDTFCKGFRKLAAKSSRIGLSTRMDLLDHDGRNEHSIVMAKLAKSVSLVRGVNRQRPAVADPKAREKMPPKLALIK